MTLKWINPYGFYGKDIDIVVAGLLKICYNVLAYKSGDFNEQRRNAEKVG